jgi:large subunit ribosomal protein L20
LQLWTQRITAGSEQHGVKFWDFMDGLHKSNIQLNKKTLSELAAWEPATFEALAKIAFDVKQAENVELDEQEEWKRSFPQLK